MEAGSVINGKYRLDRELGSGAIGTVWKAWHQQPGRWVAFKVLKGRTGEAERKRFAVEAQAMGRLNHPNCTKLYEFGYSEEEKCFYLVMEYLQGITLGRLIDDGMPPSDIVALSSQIATALAYAHHQGVVHRDLKPENVMLVDAVGGEKLVKVLDFGLARVADDDQRMTKTGEIFGTPAYMSPEQVRGSRNAGPPSDLYSLGMMMYEMLERRLPWDCQTSFDFLTAHVTQPPGPLTRLDVPPALRELVMQLLEKEPSARPTAIELWRALRELQVESNEDSTRFVVVDRDLERTLSAIVPPTVVLDPAHLDALDDATQMERIREAGLEQVVSSSGNFEFTFDDTAPSHFPLLVPPVEDDEPPLELADVPRTGRHVPPPTVQNVEPEIGPATYAKFGGVVLVVIAVVFLALTQFFSDDDARAQVVVPDELPSVTGRSGTDEQPVAARETPQPPREERVEGEQDEAPPHAKPAAHDSAEPKKATQKRKAKAPKTQKEDDAEEPTGVEQLRKTLLKSSQSKERR